MHFYNGLSAAKRIGISYKTLLRYIEKGRIVPEQAKTPTGQLVISEDQVERLRLEVLRERAMFRHPQPDIPRYRQHETDVDSQELPLTDTTLTEGMKQIGKLAARCDIQQAHIEELERRIASLESRDYPSLAQNVPTLPVPSPTTQNAIPPKEAQKSIVVRSEGGTLTASDFAAQLGIKYDDIKNYMRRGVNGERLEVTEVQHATRAGYVQKYFTVEQQQKALEVLRRHGRIK